MSTYSRRERVTKRVEFTVPADPPWGAPWAEVMKAVRAAHTELSDQGMVSEGQDAPDDLIQIRPGDDEVIVSYEAGSSRNENPQVSPSVPAERMVRALQLIDRDGCTNPMTGRCWESGRFRGARYSTDGWCDACIAFDALTAT